MSGGQISWPWLVGGRRTLVDNTPAAQRTTTDEKEILKKFFLLGVPRSTEKKSKGKGKGLQLAEINARNARCHTRLQQRIVQVIFHKSEDSKTPAAARTPKTSSPRYSLAIEIQTEWPRGFVPSPIPRPAS